MPHFVCFKDGTDLTSVVQAALVDEDIVVMDAAGAEAPWSVVVTCPTDQCQNMFTSQMAAAAGEGNVTGAVPDAEALALVDAAKELGPAKALSAAGDAAKFVIERISLVALVLGGFGIFTDLGGGFNRHPWLFGAITVISAGALALSVVALFPRVGTIKPGNLLAVSDSYKSAIRWRARFAQVATGLLLLALALAIIAFFVAAGEKNPSAGLTASFDGSGTTPTLSYTADLKSVPKGATLMVRLVGLKDATKTIGSALGSTAGTRDRSGDSSITGKVKVTRVYKSYLIVADVDWGKATAAGRAHHIEETLTVTPAPLPVSTPKPPKKSKPKKTKKATTTVTLPATTSATASASAFPSGP